MKNVIKLMLLISLIFLISACMDPEYQHLKNGDDYADQEKWSEAIAEYTKAIEIDPKLIQAYNNRATSYTEKGEYAKAIADCNKTIEMDPKSMIAYYNRSIAYLYAQKYENAISDCEKLITMGLNSPWVYYHKGMAYLGMGDYRSALSDMIRAQRLSTSSEFNQLVEQKIKSLQNMIGNSTPNQ